MIKLSKIYLILSNVLKKIPRSSQKKYLAFIATIIYIEAPIVIMIREGFFNVNLLELYFSPIKVLFKLFNFQIIFTLINLNITFLIFGFIIRAIFIVNKSGSFNFEEKEKKIDCAKNLGTYGTAEWMGRSEINKLQDYISINTNEGIIFGYFRGTEDIITLPKNTFNNRNVAVFGSSGSMKSRSFVIPNILNLIRSEESMFITDPKGELLRKCSSILEKFGYIVKALNLNNIECSNQWNILSTVEDDMSAITFAQSIMLNTKENKKAGGDFWEKGQENLLKALVLYIIKELPENERNMTSLYSFLTAKDAAKKLEMRFKFLREDHIAIQPYNIFLESSENTKIRSGMISGLATRLQLFQSKKFKMLTSENEIDLGLPGRKKCAYFAVLPDSHASFDFMACLFFSMAFIKLISIADRKPTGKLDKQVNFILDEFPNIAQIPDFEKKMATIRSRGINAFVIFQNITQLQNRYPEGKWEDILGNCDNHIFLGCNENTTAKFISDTLGSMTIKDFSESKDKYSFNPLEKKISEKYVKRNILNMDEVRRINPFHSILMLKGQNPIKMSKMDYTNHELSDEMEEIPIYYMLKEWSKEFHKDWLYSFRDEITIDEHMEEDLKERNIKALQELDMLIAECENKSFEQSNFNTNELSNQIFNIKSISNETNPEKDIKINLEKSNLIQDEYNLEFYEYEAQQIILEEEYYNELEIHEDKGISNERDLVVEDVGGDIHINIALNNEEDENDDIDIENKKELMSLSMFNK